MNSYQVMLRKDLERFAVPGTLWLALLAADNYFTLSLPVAAFAGGYRGMWEMWKFLSALLYWLTTIFLAAGIMQEDPPRGTGAFWLTRPFDRRAVIAAKFTLLAALVFLPLAVTIGGMIHAGEDPGDIVLAASASFLRTAMIPFAAALIATTTQSLGKFALTTIFILIGCFVFPGIVSGFIRYRYFGHSINGLRAQTLQSSKAVAFQGFTLVVCVGLLVWRYLHRHIRGFLAYVIIAALLCTLVSTYWSWDFIGDYAVDPPHVMSVIFGRLNSHP